MRRSTLPTAAALFLLGAATHLEAQQPPTPPPTVTPREQQQKAQQRRRGDRSKITKVEIEEAGSAVATAHDAVRILRPHWLQPPLGRAASSNVAGEGGGAKTVIVYIDDLREPELEALKHVPIAKVVEMRYLDQNRAIILRGPGHEAGVIEVVTTDKRK